MHPDAGRMWFRVAAFLIVASVGLLFVVEPGTAEFVVTVTTLVMGLLFAGILAWLARRSNP
jgi:hypothetical protein